MTFVQKLRPAILVIEDDALMRALYEALLTRWGYAVRCAESTSGAVSAVEDGFVPEAVVSDFHLGPDDTGLIALQAVFDRLGRTVPATIISGETGIISAGDIPVLRRPVLTDRLKQVVGDMLRPLTSLRLSPDCCASREAS